MEPKIIIGVDPGKSGGLAVYPHKGEPWVESMPKDINDLLRWFDDYQNRTDILVYMEQVGGFIGTRTADDGGHGDGKKRNLASGHTMFEFGKCVGHIEMAICATGLWDSVTPVSPRKWQGALGISPKVKGETQPKFKARCKSVAESIKPRIKFTLKTCDAFLIAHYGYKTYYGV